MKYLVPLIFLLFGIIPYNYSQIKKCNTPFVNERAFRENPDAENARSKLENFTGTYIQNPQKTEEVYIIPVVFHIMHWYGGENITKAQILDAMRILNEDYRKLNSDTSDIIPEFINIAADTRIEFRLATIDPDGNCTDGIVRVATQSTFYGDEDTKLESPAWPRNKYLNVWVVNTISFGAAGYSYYPSSVDGPWGEPYDGVMILYNYLGSFWPGSVMTSRVLTHEIGHYLNLMHPWGSTNDPGLPSNCDIDDEVGDTPNTVGHTSCNLYAVTCGSLDNVQNYMEYSYCDRMFTFGQKLRMRATLNSTVSERNNLWQPANLVATGTNDGAVAQVCLPQPDFTVSKSYGCNNLQVIYTDLTWNTDTITQRLWSFPGGNPASSADVNPAITYSAAGIYSASLIVTNPAGTNQITKNNLITVTDPAYGENVPLIEGFENGTFPLHPTEPEKNWDINGSGNYLWERTTVASATGDASLRVRNNLNTGGQISVLLSPNIILTGNNPNTFITFKYAYAQRNANSTDKLNVFFSDNCGQTWAMRYNNSGATLATNGGGYVSSYSPAPQDWRQETMNLNTFYNKPYMMLKFMVTSGDGNALFIDDINFLQLTDLSELTLTELYSLNIYPNPISEHTAIEFETQKVLIVNICISTILGQNVCNYEGKFPAGLNSILLKEVYGSALEQGIYFMHITIDGKTEGVKIVKN